MVRILDARRSRSRPRPETPLRREASGERGVEEAGTSESLDQVEGQMMVGA